MDDRDRFGSPIVGRKVGTAGVDDAVAQQHGPGSGAEIMGAGKFGPPGWQDDARVERVVGSDSPVPHADLRADPPSATLDRGGGGITFHILDVPPAEALDVAGEAADGQDVRIGGGPTIVRDFLAAGLVDHMHLVQVPIVLGRGVRLWDGLEALEKDCEIAVVSAPSGVTHLTVDRKTS